MGVGEDGGIHKGKVLWGRFCLKVTTSKQAAEIKSTEQQQSYTGPMSSEGVLFKRKKEHT